METLIKHLFSGDELRDIWRNEKQTEFPHLFPIDVKLSVINLQVILFSVSNFCGNHLWEIHTSLTRICNYFCASAMKIFDIPYVEYFVVKSVCNAAEYNH